MARGRQNWAAREVVAAVKMNQTITDYLTRGQLVMCTGAAVQQTPCNLVQAAHGVGPLADANASIYLGAYPYNPTKQVFDRMRYMVLWQASDARTVTAQYLLPGGAWTTSALGTALPVGWGAPFVMSNAPQYDSGMDDISLSGIAISGLMEWRLAISAAPGMDAMGWWAGAFLYRTGDTPF